MPNDAPSDKLEWTEENLSNVISALYQESTTNQTFRTQLMADPFTVLNSRIEVPAEYQGKIIAQEQTAKILILNVPPYAEAREAIAGTTTSTSTPEFIICTTDPEW